MATILVADDERGIRRLVTMTLRPHRMLEAADGDDALRLIREHRPDLVLLDVNMPGRSGLDVLAALRRDPATAGTRVIVLSARAQATDVADGLAGGADRYLTKPFSPAALQDLVEQVLADS